jgi:hypothetical protein
MFAMPVLDLGTGRFWIYWAVTIPLTVLIMIIVSLFVVPLHNIFFVFGKRILQKIRGQEANSDESGESEDECEQPSGSEDSEGGDTPEEDERGESSRTVRKRFRWHRRHETSDEEKATQSDEVN